MTEYGQTIPPKWFRDTTPKSFTKYEFVQYLYKALRTVGMKPIRCYDPVARWTGAAVNERVCLDLDAVPAVAGNWDQAVWFLDFPTAETWQTEGVTYRPCLALMAHMYYTGSSNQNFGGEWVGLINTRRRADRCALDDFQNQYRLENLTGAGSVSSNPWMYGVSMHQATSGAIGSSAALLGCMEGLRTLLWNWKPSPSTGDGSHQTLLNCRNFHVILGKAGLLIQIGTGAGRNDSADIWSGGFYFGGARIPNRGRVPILDPNLNRIHPVAQVPHLDTTLNPSTTVPAVRETTHSITNLTLAGTHPLFYLPGMQHDLKIANGAVACRAFNIENIERPLYPLYDFETKSSPRTIDSVGSHILNRVVYLTYNRYTVTGDFYGPIDPSIRIEPTPPWEDVWTFPGWRVADRTAPDGEYVDPATNTNWWLYFVSNMNCMCAVEVEGMTKLTAFASFSALAQVADTHYSLVNGLTSITGATSTVTQNTGTVGWVQTPATDEMTMTHGGTPAQQSRLDITIPMAAADVEEAYEVSLEIQNRGTTAPSGNTNPVTVWWMYDGNNTTDSNRHLTGKQVFTAGNDTGHASYNYATYTFHVHRDRLSGDLKIRIIGDIASTTSGTKTMSVRNIRVKRLK